MTSPRVTADLRPPEPPPEASQPGAVVWIRHNLFRTPASSVVTVVLGVLILLAIRGVLSFVFDPDRQWDVIPRNATNYAVGTYPRENLARIWISLDIVFFLTGLSLAVWKPSGRTSVSAITAGFRSVAVVLLLVGVLAPATFSYRVETLVLGAVLLAATLLVDRTVGTESLARDVPMLGVIASAVALFLVVLWLLPIDDSTRIPFAIGAVVGLVGHLLGRFLTERVAPGALRATVTGLWLVSLPVIYLHIQRNPVVDVDTVTGEWLPWIVGIGAGGVVLISLVSRSDRERAGVLNALVVIAAAAVWAFSVPMVARALVLLLAALSLATPTFGSSSSGRRNMLITWAVAASFVTYLFVIGAAGTGLETRNEYFGGMNLTILLALGAIALSFPIGILLALGRTSTMPVFRLMSTGYVELIRGIPLITVLFIARFGIRNFLPASFDPDPNVLVLGGITMFSAAYLAENVRGGLQSIPTGQYEAAKALGMTTAQMTMLITLPQALRAVIPAIVGQIIALFKDTSLVAIVGLAEFFRIARDVVPNQPASIGSILENLIFAAFVYWIFTYNFSRASQRLERRLGVGTR
ncbi:MAG: amino acid ABC transporter permease [Acidimicrobiia bacterium]